MFMQDQKLTTTTVNNLKKQLGKSVEINLSEPEIENSKLNVQRVRDKPVVNMGACKRARDKSIHGEQHRGKYVAVSKN